MNPKPIDSPRPSGQQGFVLVAVLALLVVLSLLAASVALASQRAVDEATSWLKRVVVTWIILNTLGFIVAYLQPLIAGGQYTG